MAMRRLIESPTDGDSRPSNPSTRRYMPSRPALADEDTDDDETYTPIPVRRRATVTTDPALQTVRSASRYLTDDEYEVVQRGQPQRDRRVTTAPQSRMDRPVDRRGALAMLGLGGIGLLGAGGAGVNWIVSEGNKLGSQFQLGAARACTMELTCGHNDKEHKTVLLFAFMMDRLFMFELPGGNTSKINITFTDTLQSHGITADPSDLNLLPAAVPVDNGKFEIHALLRWEPVGVFAAVKDINFLFVDGGGFFRSPVTAPKKK